MKARFWIALVLCAGLALFSTWTVSARGRVLPPPSDPPPVPQGYGPSLSWATVRNQGAKGMVLQEPLLTEAKRAPGSLRVNLGQPGFSLRYLQTFGQVETPYIEDTTHFNYPSGVGASGTDVWIADSYGARALKYKNDGTFLAKIGKADFRYAVSGISLDWIVEIAVDGSGNTWVVDASVAQAFKCNPSGAYVSALGQSYNRGTANNLFNSPRGIAFDSVGNIYVSDGNNHRVQVFDSSGAWIATIGTTGTPGSGDNFFNNPRHIAIDSSNRLYVADSSNHRVQVFDVSNVTAITKLATIGTGPSGSDNARFNSPQGVAVDANKIYVADSNNQRVQIFDRATRVYQSTIGTGVAGSANTQFNYPADVAVDSAGNIFVADQNNMRVQEFNSALAYVLTIGTPAVPYVTDDTHFNQPSGIAVSADGSILLTEARGQRLLKLNASGVRQASVGEPGIYGSDKNHLNYPNDVVVDTSSGRIYVADSSNHRVQIFNSDLSYYATLGTGASGSSNTQFNSPMGVAIDTAGNIYVADQNNHRVQIFDNSRNYMATLGTTGVAGNSNTQFNSPYSVAVDSARNIYVADRANHRVQVFDSSRNYVRTMGLTGSSTNDFDHLGNPIVVAVDTEGRLYVSDQWGGRVTVFDNTGAFLTSIGNSGGNRTGQMRQVEGIAFDAAGNICLADLLNHRVTKHAIGVPGWTQTNINGFGTQANRIITTLRVFGGQLYAGTYNSSGSGAQLWRTGSAWTSVMPDGFGDTTNAGIDHLIEFNGSLYASTWNWNGNSTTGVTTGGQVWRSNNGTNWSQVVSGGFGDTTNGEVYRFAAFNNQIYASTSSYTNTHGAEIWRSSTGNSGGWTRVVTNGFGDKNNIAVVSFESFNGYLYAGTYNWNSTTLTTTGGIVWRSPTGDSGTWMPVTVAGFGDANNYVVSALAAFNAYLYASTVHLSGAGSQIWRCQICNGSDWAKVADNGFGNARTTGMNALDVFNNQLYFFVGNSTTGMEVWQSANGTDWKQVGFAGFGDSNNLAPYWDNAVTVFNNSLYIGVDNSGNGGKVWRMLNPD